MSVGIFSALLLLSLSISPFLQAEEISHSGEKCTAAELGLLAGGRLAVVQRGLRRRRGGGGVPYISALLAAAATTWPAATTR